MTDVMIATPNGQMPAYVAVPAGAGPWPGVVVVHDFAGMSHDLRDQADWLASEGFLAAVPDLYYWGSRLRLPVGVWAPDQPVGQRCWDRSPTCGSDASRPTASRPCWLSSVRSTYCQTGHSPEAMNGSLMTRISVSWSEFSG
jgi:hypothetical protein